MLRDFSVNSAVLKNKIKTLKGKVKYASLACILQDDFESLMVRSSLLECFSLPSPTKSRTEASGDLTGLPLWATPLGEETEPPEPGDDPNAQEATHPTALCLMPTKLGRTWKTRFEPIDSQALSSQAHVAGGRCIGRRGSRVAELHLGEM